MKTEITGALDAPVNEGVIGDAFNIKGWAYSSTDDQCTIKVYIDGELVKSGRSGFPRYDVYQKYHTEKAYLSGFMGRVLTCALVKGTHELEVVAEDSTGASRIDRISFVKKQGGLLGKFIDRRASENFPILGGVGQNMDSFGSIAEKLLKEYITIGGLKPEHSVLDIGCGVGRLALSLATFLSGPGSYTGTDPVREVVNYANDHIGSRFNNFRFYHTDTVNELYNPDGKYKTSEYRFEFADESFDFISLTSVFTHMKYHDVENYLNEIARMLKPGGRSFITYFILNEEIRKLIDMGKSKRKFKYEFDKYFSDYKNNPEKATGFDEYVIRNLYEKSGLKIEEPIHHGKWSGFDGRSFQDIIIAVKA